MPRFDAAATSMVLTPAPARTMSDNAPASIIASVTWVDRTTRTGASVFLIAAMRVSPDASGSKMPSQPAAFSASRPDCSNLSATSTFIKTLYYGLTGYGLTGYGLTGYGLAGYGLRAISNATAVRRAASARTRVTSAA